MVQYIYNDLEVNLVMTEGLRECHIYEWVEKGFLRKEGWRDIDNFDKRISIEDILKNKHLIEIDGTIYEKPYISIVLDSGFKHTLYFDNQEDYEGKLIYFKDIINRRQK